MTLLLDVMTKRHSSKTLPFFPKTPESFIVSS